MKNYPERFARALHEQLMLRYLILNVITFGLALLVVFGSGNRRPSLIVVLSAVLSVGGFCLFSFILFPILRGAI